MLAKTSSNLTDRPILLQMLKKKGDGYYPKSQSIRSVDYCGLHNDTSEIQQICISCHGPVILYNESTQVQF
jgi:hypothetical protein